MLLVTKNVGRVYVITLLARPKGGLSYRHEKASFVSSHATVLEHNFRCVQELLVSAIGATFLCKQACTDGTSFQCPLSLVCSCCVTFPFLELFFSFLISLNVLSLAMPFLFHDMRLIDLVPSVAN